MSKLIPVFHPLSAPLFVDINTIAPTVIEGTDSQQTSYLKFGQTVDLLGLGRNPDSDDTDSIDNKVQLTSIAYRVDGEVGYHNLVAADSGRFIPTVNGDPFRQIVGFDFQVPEHGSITVTGKINLQTGHLKVDATTSSTAIEALGYKIDANTINYNRRPLAA